ncbi:methyltransferase domain-containing protein [Patulibacter americanus]|uniref:methyltransferase domain-containing protein n=1 Tax=Patulibacter americanus TaxID=588672 RepID=UPI0003B613C2|nr:methyltransferase domain-containing protein [Patulibacter americanus]
MNICTIIAKNYVAHARVLASSFTAHHPGSRCFVLFVDDVEGYLDLADEPFEVVRAEDLDIDPTDLDEMRGIYNILEFSTAVKPWLLRYMLDHHDDGSGICYFDPDIQVHSRMTELEAALQESSVVLTPHLTAPMPRDGKKPSETDILIAGVYNLGFIGLSASDETDHLVAWWQERLRTDCRVDTEKGFFVDQRWIDFVPGMVRSLHLLELPSYNIAYWNLPTRPLGKAGEQVEVDGHPLRFFHFSGYSPDRRDQLSKHQNRVVLRADPVLRELCDGYGDALEAAGFQEVRTLPYTHDVLPNGLQIDHLSRALYRAAIEAGDFEGSIFTPMGSKDFLAWLQEPAPGFPGLTRYLHALWSMRVDLSAAYPDVAASDLDGFIGWVREYGREQVPIPDELLPPAVASGVSAEPAAPAPAAPVEPVAPSPVPFGVNVAGYLRSELGIGEVARQLTGALDTTPIPSVPVGLVAPASRQGHAYVASGHRENPFPVNLVFVNADGLPAFADDIGDAFFRDRHTIGYWWWELGRFPEHLVPSFDLVDEVWAGSAFVAETLAAVSPVPVVKMPVPIEFAAPPALAPGEAGWPDAFTFLFSWDYNSVFRRKNPLALVQAYTQAFGPDDGAALVLKCINHDRDPAHHAELRRAIDGRPDILLFDDYLSVRDKNRFMASCDCYVSLHRSEGLGLTMAEAMYLGKPVVATNYSGNTEFMTAENSFPVDYRLVPVGDDAAPYPADDEWAEPDVAHAARQMRRVFDDPQERRRRADRAAADIRERHSPKAVGLQLERRLRRIEGARAASGARLEAVPRSAEVTRAADDLARLVERGTVPRRPSRFGRPGAAVRKVALRAMKPYTTYQQDINYTVMEAVAKARDEALNALGRTAAREVEDQATVLAELRRQAQRIDVLGERLADEVIQRGRLQTDAQPILQDAQRLVQEVRSVPYMSSDVFRVRDAGPAGRVLGYDHAGEDRSPAEDYRAFEDLFRGGEDFIADRQRRYLPIIGDRGPVLDLGCGRGEFLDVLTDAGIPARGVDSDAGMVARCKAKGHQDVELGDGIEYLESCEDGSLGVIFSAQVVEHLPPEALRRLLAVAPRKLKPGGLFIAETVNPHSVPALKAFWVDITHQHPLFPEAMLAFCRIAGFGSAYFFHPNGEGDVDRDRYTTGEYAVVATV